MVVDVEARPRGPYDFPLFELSKWIHISSPVTSLSLTSRILHVESRCSPFLGVKLILRSKWKVLENKGIILQLRNRPKKKTI